MLDRDPEKRLTVEQIRVSNRMVSHSSLSPTWRSSRSFLSIETEPRLACSCRPAEQGGEPFGRPHGRRADGRRDQQGRQERVICLVSRSPSSLSCELIELMNALLLLLALSSELCKSSSVSLLRSDPPERPRWTAPSSPKTAPLPPPRLTLHLVLATLPCKYRQTLRPKPGQVGPHRRPPTRCWPLRR